jgi:hypothetical protein
VIVGGENSHQLHLQGATELQDLATFHRIHSNLQIQLGLVPRKCAVMKVESHRKIMGETWKKTWSVL